MKILITGVNGFVGKILSRELTETGYDVLGVDLKGNNNTFSVDITDFDSINSVIKKCNPDYIIHLAAISKVDYKNPTKLYNINIFGTNNILTSAINMKKIPGILLVSSSQVYGNVDEVSLPITENRPVNPINHYGSSKAAAENIAKTFNMEYNLPLTIVRPFNHVGVGQDIHFVVPKIVKAFKQRKNILELGNIQTIRDFLDVRDVVKAYIKIIEKFPDGEIFNLSSGKGIKISGIISKLEDITGHKIQLSKADPFIRKNEIKNVIGDSSKIMDYLNWEPCYDIDDTLKWMIND